jgi:FkbM family methyltransferase
MGESRVLETGCADRGARGEASVGVDLTAHDRAVSWVAVVSAIDRLTSSMLQLTSFVEKNLLFWLATSRTRRINHAIWRRVSVDMDPLGALIARLDRHAPIWSDRLQWRRNRQRDAALRVMDALVARGGLTVDIGAERGLFSSRMLDLVGRNGTVHAFEPNPIHQPRLQALAKDRRLRIHATALSDQNGNATLRIPVFDGQPHPGLASLENGSGIDGETAVVPTARLDDVLELSSPVSFIKCDVEGHEEAVFRGAQEMLTRCRPSILVELEERHRSGAVSSFVSQFAGLGYEGWAVFPSGLRPVSEFDLERDQLAFINGAPVDVMPDGYVHNFVFVLASTDVGCVIDPACRR